MSNTNEGPARSDFQESREVPSCGAHCEHEHGDQAESDEQLEVYRLRARVAVLERQLAEPGYCDALRETCEGVARLLPAPTGPDMHDQVEMLPEWVAEALAARGADNERLRGLIKAAEYAVHGEYEDGDTWSECPWCSETWSHTATCPAFSASGVVR